MLSIGRIRPGGAEYYVGEIATSAEDYYLGHGEAPGRWVGSLAAEIGLDGEVDPEHFRALLEGRHPVTGDLLVEGRRTKAPYVSEAPEADWLSAKDAAAQLGVSERFVRRLLAGGDLPGEKARSETTNRIGWRVQRVEVNRYAESHKPAKARPGFAALGSAADAGEVQRLADRFLASDRVDVLAGPTSGRNSEVVVGLGGAGTSSVSPDWSSQGWRLIASAPWGADHSFAW